MVTKVTKKRRKIVLTHASVLYTGAGIRAKDGRRVGEDDLGAIPDGALVADPKTRKILWAGRTADLPARYAKERRIDLGKRRCIIPGMVDCHTHLIFAGNRADEFAARCGGATYQEIAAQGGGIQATVNATRQASAHELETLAIARLQEMRSHGVRTIEIKSGYGLSTEAELKILKIIPKLRKHFPDLTLTSTFLGAHAFPKDKARSEYLADIVNDMLPRVAKQKLANSCDVFIDEGYFTLHEGRQILEKAKDLGLAVKVHADELGNTESATLAAQLHAQSADHLLKISDQGLEALAKSQTVAVLLPGTAFYLKTAHAPARKLLDAGAIVALATDFNPGTCMCTSLPTIMTIAALYLGMSKAELFASVTYNGARALGLEKRKGTLEAGMDADFAVLPFPSFEELYYRFGWCQL